MATGSERQDFNNFDKIGGFQRRTMNCQLRLGINSELKRALGTWDRGGNLNAPQQARGQ